ncbi:MAG: branched-chain amino acid ABC transporter permease [Acidimicrobiia bacterium]
MNHVNTVTDGPVTRRRPRLPAGLDPGTAALGGLLTVIVVALVPPILRNDFPGLFLQRLFDSLSNGAAYALTAIAVVLIYQATGLINFTQANLSMFGAYIAWQFAVGWGLPVWVGIGVACAVMAVVGAGIERTLIRPLNARDDLPIVLITFGLAAVLESLAGGIWGLEFHKFPSPFPAEPDDYLAIGGARLRIETLGTLAVAAVLLVGLWALLTRTALGLRFRAVSSNKESARLAGIRIGPTLQVGWALAAALGTLGAALVANRTNLEPGFMAKLVIFAFAAATLGGLDSINGAVVGAFGIAAVQSLLTGYAQELPGLGWLKSNFALVVAFAVILVVLVFRPSGLFGTRTVQRV